MVDHVGEGMSRVPILVILGATGSGKSRLGIELARRFAGEIISADSMQVYKGLDIITAKVTKEERRMAPHHMLDVIEPPKEFSVINFRDMVLPIMDDLLAKKKMPIVVGGTNYYIESLLWHILISDPNSPGTWNEREAWRMEEEEEEENLANEEEENGDTPAKKSKLLELSNQELHDRLKLVDPESAECLHPNDRRKVLRSLEVFKQHGTKHSDLLREQRAAGGSGLGGPLRHPNSVILWLRCEKKILNERLERRVDEMLEAGLVEELLDFHRRYNEERIKLDSSPDYTKGIFQSIGFKEFHAYLVLSEEERRSEKGQALLKTGVEDLKRVTKRYALRQERWITNRLIRRQDRQVPPVYALNCAYLDKWNENVLEPASRLISAVLRGEKPELEPLKEDIENCKTTDSSTRKLNYCEVCEKLILGEQWTIHMKGNKHWRMVKRKRRLEQAASVQEKQE